MLQNIVNPTGRLLPCQSPLQLRKMRCLALRYLLLDLRVHEANLSKLKMVLSCIVWVQQLIDLRIFLVVYFVQTALLNVYFVYQLCVLVFNVRYLRCLRYSVLLIVNQVQQLHPLWVWYVHICPAFGLFNFFLNCWFGTFNNILKFSFEFSILLHLAF